ncbi:hypothetical protein ES707_20479 [subsurface metagenome]
MTKEPKKMWRCAKDSLGYCDGEPVWKEPPRIATYEGGVPYGDVGGNCKLDPKTCGKYLRYSQLLEARLRKEAKVAK